MKLYIRLIVRPGAFLYYVSMEENKVLFTYNKDFATTFDSRDSAIEMIKKILDKTDWKFNFEITSY